MRNRTLIRFIALPVLFAGLAVAPLSANTIAHWDMTPTGGSPQTLDLATASGQGTHTGSQAVGAAYDHLLSLNGNGDAFATSTTVPPSSMFRPGFGGGSDSYNAGSIATVDGALLFPQDFYGNEFQLDAWTVELCFRSDGDQSAGGTQQLLLNGEFAFEWGMMLNENAPGGLRLTAFNGVSYTPLDLADRNYANGQWYYAVASYSAATKVLKLRVRGEDGTVSSTQQTLVIDPYKGAPSNLFIGRNTFSRTAAPRTFLGLIDEVRISDTIVPDDELMGDLAGPPSAGDTVVISRWTMDNYEAGVEDPIVFDDRTAVGEGIRTGSFAVAAAQDDLALFGDINDFPTQSVVPPPAMVAAGQSAGTTSFDSSYLAFGGVKNGVLCFPQDRYGAEFPFNGSFTFEAFFMTTDPETGLPSNESGSGNMQLLLNAEHDMKSALIVNENAPGGIRFAINDSKGTIPACDLAARNYADGTWHYVQATYNAALGGKGLMKIVVLNQDGTIDTSSVDVGAVYPNFVSLSPAYNNLFVGRNRYAASEDHRNFNGLIDEVQVTKGVIAAADQLGNLDNLGTYAVCLSLYSVPAEGGTTTGSGAYAPGSTVAVTATARPGYLFTGWSGNFITEPAGFTTPPLGADLAAAATFAPDTSDTDGDGLSAYQELVVHGTNPTVADTDGDGLNDGQEVNTIGSDPRSDDSALVAYLGSAAAGMGVSIQRDPGTGTFFLDLDLTQSTDLVGWDDLAVGPGAVTVSGGNIVVELPDPPAPAAFWRFIGSQGTAP